MSTLLDMFVVGFKSDGLKDFEQNLKKTETALEKAKNKVHELEKEQNRLEKSSVKDEQAIEDVKLKLIDARAEVVEFGDKLAVMQGKSQYQLLQLRKNFASLMKTVGMLATVGIAVRQSMQFYEQAEQLDFLAQKTNVAVESLQRLGNAAQRYGGNTESTASTVEQFTTKEFKEKALKVGVRVAGSPEQTLENIAERMEKLKDDSKKWELAKTLGLDEGTTRMLVQGAAKYREELKRADKYKLYTKEDIERMRDYRQIQQDIRMNVQSIQGAVARFLLPALTQVSKFLRAITDWAREHEGGVKIAGIFLAIAAGVGAVVGGIHLLNGALSLLLANPVALTIAAWAITITALVAIIQDLFTFLRGGDSLIGKLWESWGYDLEEIRRGFEIWGENIARWWNNFLSIFNKKIEWQNAAKDIDIMKPLTAEESESLFANMRKGKAMLTAYNNNPLNAINTQSISNMYQTKALTSTMANSNQNVTNNLDKRVNINNMTIQTQATNGRELAQDLQQTVADLDNGFVA